MRDQLGNKLTPGNLVHWRFPKEIAEGGLLFRVIGVQEPSKLVATDHTPTGSVLSLQVDLPVDSGDPRREALVAGLMRIIDPKQEAAMEQFAEQQETARVTKKAERPQ